MNELIELNAWHWLGFSLLLLILELLSLSGFLLWIAVSAGIVSLILLGFSDVPVAYQFLIFSVASLMSCMVWRYYLQHRPTRTNNPALNRRNEQYIGRLFTLEQPIIGGRGKIRVDDSTWRIEGKDLPAGTKIRITGVDGVILRVTAVDTHE